MVQHTTEGVKFAPLITHSFPLLAPHHILESEKFNIRYTEPTQIDNIPDKLRWYRYHHAMLQKEVADYIGINRRTYISYEETGRDYYPIEDMKKLSELYSVSVTELLDDYNMFLYNDQGKQIRDNRMKLHMTQSEYATMLGVKLSNLKQWERNRVRMFKSTWEKYFK